MNEEGRMAELSAYLFSLRNRGSKLGLERMQKLSGALGNPQNCFKSILVGGTSGKGSTTAMLASVLQEAGYRTGRFTSPHLSSLTERIAVDGVDIAESGLAAAVSKIRAAISGMDGDTGFEHPTFFEIITTAAFMHFRDAKVDFAVLEVGLGGRLDATNIVNPLVSVITNVSLEHTRILGDTVGKIAMEKAGIIKRNGRVVTASRDKDALAVIENVCNERNASLLRVGREISVSRTSASIEGQEFDVSLGSTRYVGLRVPLLGRHQLDNAACALGAIHSIGAGIPEPAMRSGLSRVSWPGRLEIVRRNPLVVLDGAKDADAMARLARTIREDIKYERLILVIGISSDKNIPGMSDAIIPLADVVVASEHGVDGRALPAEELQKHAKRHGKAAIVIRDVRDAVKKAVSMAGEGDLVLVTGSLFTVGDAREALKGGAQSKHGAMLGRDLNEIPKK